MQWLREVEAAFRSKQQGEDKFHAKSIWEAHQPTWGRRPGAGSSSGKGVWDAVNKKLISIPYHPRHIWEDCRCTDNSNAGMGNPGHFPCWEAAKDLQAAVQQRPKDHVDQDAAQVPSSWLQQL